MFGVFDFRSWRISTEEDGLSQSGTSRGGAQSLFLVRNQILRMSGLWAQAQCLGKASAPCSETPGDKASVVSTNPKSRVQEQEASPHPFSRPQLLDIPVEAYWTFWLRLTGSVLGSVASPPTPHSHKPQSLERTAGRPSACPPPFERLTQ